ncbi:hypothetical protein GY45DRAFT_1437050 [Cubamyces sp. BRFM 1775]|nr:hypothetical protein GY45DRAFT_1437050 [Cubamyces sp. BRFM 1775]
MPLSLYWNHRGEPDEAESCTESFEHWDAGQPLDEPQRTIVQAVEEALSVKVMQIDVRAMTRNVVLDVELDDGRRVIIRAPNVKYEKWQLEANDVSIPMMKREIGITKWLKANSRIPIPAIYSVVTSSHPEAIPIIVMEKLLGAEVFDVVGKYPYYAKERLMHGFADVQVQLFSLQTPQLIGTAYIDGDKMSVIPRVAIAPAKTSSKVYDSLEAYVASQIEMRKRSLEDQDEATRTRGLRVLDRIVKMLPSIYAHLSRSAHRRCTLVHDDLSPVNVLMDAEGNITGVLDWEYQSIMPAVLAVEYPTCIRYDGMHDPRYTPTLEVENTWWLVGPEDAPKLREAYAEAIKTKDRECWEALVDGEFLRRVLEWVTSDKDFDVLERWLDAAVRVD